MEMPPPNEVSVVFYRSPDRYNYVDFCVRSVCRSPYTHVALRIGNWTLHIGKDFPSQWIMHDMMSERWEPTAEIKIGDIVCHALEPRFKEYEGQILDRLRCWLYGFLIVGPNMDWLIPYPEPCTCVSIVRDILADHFDIHVTGKHPGTLYDQLKEICNG